MPIQRSKAIPSYILYNNTTDLTPFINHPRVLVLAKPKWYVKASKQISTIIDGQRQDFVDLVVALHIIAPLQKSKIKGTIPGSMLPESVGVSPLIVGAVPIPEARLGLAAQVPPRPETTEGLDAGPIL
jgi:hypothetical protein